MDHMISVENLVKRYRKAKQNAVDGVTFHVNPGDFFAFLGPNGAGKTTTISILTTTLAPTSGKVTIAGYDLETQSSHVRQNIGVIFQNPSLDENLTAEENVRFHCTLYNMYAFRPFFSLMPDAYKNKVHELASLLGLEKDMFKAIKTFSGGMKRKLEIIRSLMHNPKVLFLDEPTSGLDPVSRKNLWDYLQKVRDEENTTIFLTTHYLEEAEAADDVAIINHGKVVEQGSPQEIKAKLVENYMVLGTDKPDQLSDELEKLGYQHKGTKKITIKIESDKEAIEILKKVKTPIEKFDIHTPTLDEAYFEIINTQNEKDNASN